jgi:hypothetical protein
MGWTFGTKLNILDMSGNKEIMSARPALGLLIMRDLSRQAGNVGIMSLGR